MIATKVAYNTHLWQKWIKVTNIVKLDISECPVLMIIIIEFTVTFDKSFKIEKLYVHTIDIFSSWKHH